VQGSDCFGGEYQSFFFFVMASERQTIVEVLKDWVVAILQFVFFVFRLLASELVETLRLFVLS
jgi:hypothetical protein